MLGYDAQIDSAAVHAPPITVQSLCDLAVNKIEALGGISWHGSAHSQSWSRGRETADIGVMKHACATGSQQCCASSNPHAKWSVDQERGVDFFQSLTVCEDIVGDYTSQSGGATV